MLKSFILFAIILLVPPGDLMGQADKYFESSAQKMGTTFRIVFYTTDSAFAAAAFQSCWDRVDALNMIFSDYEEESEVSRLSRSSGSNSYLSVSVELWEVMRWSQELSNQSAGAFDITIGPLSKCWRRAIRRQEMPSDVELAMAKSNVDYRKIDLKEATKSVRLNNSNTHLDFGGIAKGYAVDEIVKVLKEHQIHSMLVDGGGDIYAGLSPPDSMGWKVYVPSLDKAIILNEEAIASSGDTYKYLDWGGQRYSHIVDPRTGRGVMDMDVVNVMASDCMTADALASTIGIIGKDKGQSILELYEGAHLAR